MADEGKKATRAELAEAVHELRDEVARLRAEQAAHHCHGHACGHVHCNWGHCGCWTWHGYSYSYPTVPPCTTGGTVTTSGTLNVTAFSGESFSVPAVTSLAAGPSQTVTLGYVN